MMKLSAMPIIVKERGINFVYQTIQKKMTTSADGSMEKKDGKGKRLAGGSGKGR